MLWCVLFPLSRVFFLLLLIPLAFLRAIVSSYFEGNRDIVRRTKPYFSQVFRRIAEDVTVDDVVREVFVMLW